MAIDGRSGVALAQHAAVLLAQKKPEKAAEMYEKIVEYHPSDVRGYLALSKIYTGLDQKDRASSVLSRMERQTKDKLVTTLARIELELRTGNPDVAIKMASKLVANYPKNFAGHMLLANGKIAKNDLDGAIKSLGNAIKYSERKEPVLQMAQLYLRQKREKEAASALEKWLEKRDNPDVRFFLASVYQSVGKLMDAEVHYEKLLKLDQGNPLVLNNLTLIYLETDADKALATAELAMVRAGNRPEIMDTYGWVLVKTGQVEKGIAQLSRALALIDNPEIRYHLAYALEKRDKNEEALKHLDVLKRNTALSSELKKQIEQLETILSKK